MKEANARTIARVERERERERESCSIEDTALSSCTEKNTNLTTGKLYIIYRKMQINMQIKHR